MQSCTSCKYLDMKNTKPGRTSGYLYYCSANRVYVNAAKEDCSGYEEDFDKSTADRNEIYHNCLVYNDEVTAHGCNTCAYLDPDKKASGKGGGYVYYCKKKDTYVNAAKDNCELWSEGYRSSFESNEIYKNSNNYTDNDSSQTGKYLVILILIIIAGIILMIFQK